MNDRVDDEADFVDVLLQPEEDNKLSDYDIRLTLWLEPADSCRILTSQTCLLMLLQLLNSKVRIFLVWFAFLKWICNWQGLKPTLMGCHLVSFSCILPNIVFKEVEECTDMKLYLSSHFNSSKNLLNWHTW